ncbi:MFS transporter [Candidatus Saccharibacteria bacterium]|nr:MFS transporter [Candidatus Saccharibacteria bacterium]
MKTVAKLKLIEFLDGMYFSTIITNLFAVSEGVPLYHAVIAQSVFTGTVFLSEIPTGVIADKFGRKTSMALGYFTSAIGLMALVISPTTIGLYVMNIIRAIGLSMVSGANEALLYEASKDEGLDYKKQSSIVLSNGIAGLFVAGIVSGIVYQVFSSVSFVSLILATVALQLVITAISLTLHDGSKDQSKQKSIVKQELKAFEMVANTLSLMRKNQTIFALTIAGLMTVCNEYFLYGTVAIHFENLGNVSSFWAGGAISFGLFVNFILQRYVYKLEDYLTFEKAFALIKLGSITGYLLLALATQNTLVIIIAIATMGVFNIERPIVSDYANQELQSSVRATVLSGMSLASRFAKMTLTIILGIIVAGGSLRPGFLAQGLFMAVGLAISYWLLVRCGCVRRFKNVTTEQQPVM